GALPQEPGKGQPAQGQRPGLQEVPPRHPIAGGTAGTGDQCQHGETPYKPACETQKAMAAKNAKNAKKTQEKKSVNQGFFLPAAFSLRLSLCFLRSLRPFSSLYSMIEQELLGVDHHPDDVLVGRLHVLFLLLDVLHERLRLLLARLARQG